MSLVITVVAVVRLLILGNGLFVAAEFAAIRARKTRVQQFAEEGNWPAQKLVPIKASPKSLDTFIASCQVGITVTSLALGAYAQSTIADGLAEPLAGLGNLTLPVAHSISATFILLALTAIQIIISELLPKNIAMQFPEEVAFATVMPVLWLQPFLRPFIWLFNGSGEAILRLLNVNLSDDAHGHFHSPAEIEMLVVDSHEGGLIDDKEQQMLRNAFRLRELTARQIMVPRTRLVAAADTSPVADVLREAIAAGFTRIPIYTDHIDNITGFVHVKELFPLFKKEEADLSGVLREIVYVPETMPVSDVWQTLNSRRQYMAVVFDEYGGTAGLITFEDLIEEIFGELQDEFDQEFDALYYHDSVGRTHLRGDLLIADVNEYFNLNLPDDENDTLGGLVFSRLGRIPKEGDEVTIGALTLRVDKEEDQSIVELSLVLPTDTQPEVDEWEISRNE